VPEHEIITRNRKSNYQNVKWPCMLEKYLRCEDVRERFSCSVVNQVENLQCEISCKLHCVLGSLLRPAVTGSCDPLIIRSVKIHGTQYPCWATSNTAILLAEISYIWTKTFIMLYKSLVRSHLEYANCVWSPYGCD